MKVGQKLGVELSGWIDMTPALCQYEIQAKLVYGVHVYRHRELMKWVRDNKGNIKKPKSRYNRWIEGKPHNG